MIITKQCAAISSKIQIDQGCARTTLGLAYDVARLQANSSHSNLGRLTDLRGQRAQGQGLQSDQMYYLQVDAKLVSEAVYLSLHVPAAKLRI